MKKPAVFLTILVILLILLAGWVLYSQNSASPINPVLSPTVTNSPTPITSTSKLPTKYITAQDWPPVKMVDEKPYKCTEAGSEQAPAGKTSEVTVNHHTYCVTVESEGAAGSVYTNYAYAVAKGNKTEIFTFSLRFVQCANYEDPQKTACEKERQEFNIDNFMDSYIQANL